jgi:hypothetical protein
LFVFAVDFIDYVFVFAVNIALYEGDSCVFVLHFMETAARAERTDDATALVMKGRIYLFVAFNH